MTRSLVLWAVCERNGKGWKPVLGTLATTRKEAVTKYEWDAFYVRRRKMGKARAMRVEVTPIEPVGSHAP